MEICQIAKYAISIKISMVFILSKCKIWHDYLVLLIFFCYFRHFLRTLGNCVYKHNIANIM